MKTIDIAKKALRSNYTTKGIKAGSTHFNTIWARDSFYASWGSLEIKDYRVVRKNLELFLKNTKKNGWVPLRIGASRTGQYLNFLGFKQKSKKPMYYQDKGFNQAIDSNLLLLITLDKYMDKTKDKKLAKKYLETIKNTVIWLEKKEKKGLIYAGKYSTWQDMIKKKGFVLYTNVLHYQALISVSNILRKLKVKNRFIEKAEIIKEKINKEFYNKKLGFYIDYFDKHKDLEIFSTDGNMLAIIFGVADNKKSLSILKKADKLKISDDIPSYTNFPEHGFPQVFTPFYFLGMKDYNDFGVCWTWLGCLHAMALKKAGDKKRAKKVLKKLEDHVLREQDFYEVYDPKTGLPLKRLVYNSEKSFAWTAGLFIVAEKMR